MAYQYICDFQYSIRYLNDRPDRYTWCSLGLGAKRGMRRILYGEPNKGAIELKNVYELLQMWKEHVSKTLKLEIKNTYINMTTNKKLEDIEKDYMLFKDLKMCDVQHWLCEYDKYCRGGSKKRRYNGF
jgi:MoaA/NifB/PqqE/SkfB family radical SAM enzyme